MFPFMLILEISEGQIFTAGLTLIYILLAPAAIVAIFMMVERKSTLALNLIRIYLWANIPLCMLGGMVSAAESGEATESMVGAMLGIILVIPIALYWQQKSHSEYLKSFNH